MRLEEIGPPDVTVDSDLRWIIQRLNDLDNEVKRLKQKVAYLEGVTAV